MDSALSPRDIQARIRAGESVEAVAQAAGVPVERVEPFAAPVLAERSHVAGLALSGPVRRRGEHASVRQLRTASTEALVARGIDPDDVEWDAALLGARRWQVTATFRRGKKDHVAQFVYDLNGRFSVAGNDDARWLIGESNTPPAPKPTPVPAEDRDDELAIVRAISEADDADVNDAYSEAELAEVDGVYELVAGDDPEMDALYDMLASFDEDSVKIYAGLVRPESPPVLADGPRSAATPPLPDGARVEPLYVPDDVAAQSPAALPEDDEGDKADEDDGLEPTVILAFDADDDDEATPEPAEEPITESQQPALVEDVDLPDTARKTGRKGRRASVPSWDEIMFGAPRQDKDRR